MVDVAERESALETAAPALLADKAAQGLSVPCMKAFADAMGTRLREGIRLLDYGCGSGRFGAYLATRVRDFMYWGADLRDQVEKPEWVAARAPLAGDPRYRGFVTLDRLESTRALKDATDALLLSVLTHLPHGALYSVLRRLWPVAKHGGTIHASLYLGEPMSAQSPKNLGEDGLPIYWRRVVHTQTTVDEACWALGLRWEPTGEWTKEWPQTICAFRRA